MRITHIIGSLDAATGGPPMVASRLAAAQAQLGCQVRIVCYASTQGDCDAGREQVDVQAIPGFEQVEVQTIPHGGFSERWTGRLAGRFFKNHFRTGERDDMVHLHGVWEPILKQASVACRRENVPYAIAPHGMLHPWSLAQRRWKKHVALCLGYRRMLRDATLIHTLNEDEALALGALGLSSQCRVIPNGIFFEEIEPLPSAGSFYQACPPLNGRPFVLFLSRLHPKKGLDRLADAFAHLAEKHETVQLVVAGPDGGAQSDFEKQVTQLGLSGRVHLVGPLWGQAKFSAMVDATCFCLPSYQEGFSVAILEALASGLPVVISKACCFPQVQEADAGRYLDLSASDAKVKLADTMYEILTDPVKAQAMSQAGRQLIEGRYTWSGIAQRSLDAYKECIQS